MSTLPYRLTSMKVMKVISTGVSLHEDASECTA